MFIEDHKKETEKKKQTNIQEMEMIKTIKKIMSDRSSGFREDFQICLAARSLNRT